SLRDWSSDVCSSDLDDGLSVKRLIATSPDAWGESGYRLNNFQYTPGQDLKGRDGLGALVISERLKPSNLPLSVPGGRLAVFGTRSEERRVGKEWRDR